MIKGTPELIAGRREEIMNACEALYERKRFMEITLKDIGNEVPFSRPTIYNYFQTKEEIFLALFEREYTLWADDLKTLTAEAKGLSRTALAERIADTLQKRKLLLKLLSVNLYDMEENSRRERLVSFKRTFKAAREALTALLRRAYPDIRDEELQSFLYVFLPYMHGIYPYAFATEKQKAAMDEVGIEHPEVTIRELVKAGLLRMLP